VVIAVSSGTGGTIVELCLTGEISLPINVCTDRGLSENIVELQRTTTLPGICRAAFATRRVKKQ